VPNPVNFNFTAGQVASSSQVDSDLYQIWNFLGVMTTALNGPTYCPAPAFSSIVPGIGIAAVVGSPIPGAGTALTLSLSHGEYCDVASAQIITGIKIFEGGIEIDSIAASDTSGINGGDLYVHTANGKAVHFTDSGVTVDNFVISDNGSVTVSRGLFTALIIAIGSAGGATITTGSAVPTGANIAGSVYMRTPGAVGARHYIGQGGTAWAAVAGV